MTIKEIILNKLFNIKKNIMFFYYKHDYEIDITIAGICTLLALIAIYMIWDYITASYIRQYIMDHQ